MEKDDKDVITIQKKHIYLAGIALVVFIGGFLANSLTSAPTSTKAEAVTAVQEPPTQPAQAPKVDVSVGDDPSIGPADAPVTMIEFGDFACGFTAKAYITVEKLMEVYDGKIRFVYKNFQTMRGWSPKAMVASECAYNQGNEGFWYFYNELFQGRNSDSISEMNIDSKVMEWAREADLDVDAFKNCYDAQETLPEIQEDIQEGRGLGISGTPAFFINGRKIDGAQPFSVFKQVIDAELEK